MAAALLSSEIPGYPVRRGKVRDVYELPQELLMIATDRISAFDWVMPNGIPQKGQILTQLSAFWFDLLKIENHLLSLDPVAARPELLPYQEQLAARSMLVKKAEVVPIECVVRGYIEGSGWKEYQKQGTACGIPLPPGLKQGSQLPETIFTPATKEESGHDINIPFSRMVEIVGRETAEELRTRSIEVYEQAAEHARSRGIIIADTKFEWGWNDGKLILIDEVLTPDSSRFWDASTYAPGKSQPSYDKQFVRDWLETTDWDKESPPPTLPDSVVTHTRQKYAEAFERLSGKAFVAQ